MHVAGEEFCRQRTMRDDGNWTHMSLDNLGNDEGRSHTYQAGGWYRREQGQNPMIMGTFESIWKSERAALRHEPV